MHSILTGAEIRLMVGVILLVAMGVLAKSCRTVKPPPAVMDELRAE